MVVVLVLLLPDTEFGKVDQRWHGREGNWDPETVGVLQCEVLGNDGSRARSIALQGVSDAIEMTW